MTREELRAWLDRPAKCQGECDNIDCRNTHHWRDFLNENGELVEPVRRTGPDQVNAKQRCGCEQCAVKP